ncbi:MAG: hypothetical protein NTW86_25540 [Candidatus Sumerlaeota bacterium]|nr:hypothetical protein [Candidatus Sumerlaeota bacterium]
MNRRIRVTLVLQFLVCWAMAVAHGAAAKIDYAQLAATRPGEAQAAIAKLPEAERVAVLRDLLASPKAEVRRFAGAASRATFELGVRRDVEKALAREKDEKTSTTLAQALSLLRVYEKVALPKEELNALLAAGGATERADQREGLRPVALDLTVQNEEGKPLAGAQAFAYMKDYAVRAPADKFAQADARGRIVLPLAPGAWTIVAFSPDTYGKTHPGRAVFLVGKNRSLEKTTETVTLRPDAELQMTIEGKGAGEADEVHVIDRPQGPQIAFPSLGASRNGRLVVETTKGAPLSVLGMGGKKAAEHWVAFEPKAEAPEEVKWTPSGEQSARIRLKGPSHLKKVDSAELQIRQFGHDATPASVEGAPSQTILVSPGEIELQYTIKGGRQQFIYSPKLYRLTPGQTLALTLDSPSTATVFHQVYPNFYGKKNVLGAGLLAQDANGHFLTGIQLAGGLKLAFQFSATLDGKPLDETQKPDGRFFREMGHDVDPKSLPSIRYRVGRGVVPGLPAELPGTEWTTYSTEHYTFHYAPPLRERIERLAKGTERLYRTILDVYGQPPKWKRTDIFMRAILPPTVGGSSSAAGILLPTSVFLSARWFEMESMTPLPHEMLHRFGFGHDDFMNTWVSEIRRRLRESETPIVAINPKPPLQNSILALLRGEPDDAALTAVPWVILGRYGIKPFQGYEHVTRLWERTLQAKGLTDVESDCAIFSETSAEDLRDLFVAAGLSVRDDAVDTAREAIAEMKQAPPASAPESAPVAASRPAGASNPEIDRALAEAGRRKGPQSVAALRRVMPLVPELDVNRARVRTYMRLSKAFYDQQALDDAYEAARDAQREALKVSRQYYELCRRIMLDGLMGKPLMMGHM